MEDNSKKNDMLKTLIEKSTEPIFKAKGQLSQYPSIKEILEKALADENVRNCNIKYL